MRLQARPADTRCPYCHDHLEVMGEARLSCPDCGTEHHVACIRELRRCSTFGCERSLVVDPDLSVDLRIQREIRARARERVRNFVQRNTQRVSPEASYREALADVDACSNRGDWRNAGFAFERAQRLRTELSPECAHELRGEHERASRVSARGAQQAIREEGASTAGLERVRRAAILGLLSGWAMWVVAVLILEASGLGLPWFVTLLLAFAPLPLVVPFARHLTRSFEPPELD